MTKAFLIQEMMVNNSDGHGVEICIFQHENNGIFAIDSSFLIQNFEDDETPIINDPFNKDMEVELIGLD